MAQKFVTNLNINQNELQNAKFQFSAGDPGSGEFEGRLVYDTTNNIIKYYNSSAWKQVLTDVTSNTTALTVTAGTAGSPQLTIAEANGSTAGIMSAAHYTLVNNATEADTASTIMKRDASGHVNVTKVTGLAEPTNASDAATKGYVDARAAGLDPKESVVAASTANVTLASAVENGDTLDGVTLSTGDRILLKDQTTGSQNGVYTVNASGAPTRATDFDTGTEATAGCFFFVEQGTANANRGYVLQSKSGGGTYTIDTDTLTFSQFSGAGQIDAGAGLTKNGDVLTVGQGDGITVNANDVALASSTAGDGITFTSGVLSISTNAAGDGLGIASGVLSVNIAAAGGLETSGDNVQIKINTGIAGLETDSSGLALKSDVAGTGITFTAGVLSADASNLAASGSGGVTGTLPVGSGGTGSTTAADARGNGFLAAGDSSGGTRTTSNPLISRTVAQNVGDASATSYTITHGLGTRDVTVQVYDSSTYDTIICDVVRTDTHSATISFSTAPASNAYRVVVTGQG